MYKSITSIVIFTCLFVAVGANARGLGDYARDYSSRVERTRINRASITVRRDARMATRMLQRQSRSRVVKQSVRQKMRIAPLDRLTARRQERIRRTRMLIKREDARQVMRTPEYRVANIQVKVNWRLDARRRSDLRDIIEVLARYVANPSLKNSNLIPSSEMNICKTKYELCDEGVNLDLLIINTELHRYPTDPEEPMESNITGYTIQETSSGTLLLKAPKGNAGKVIELEWRPIGN